uniref:Uncharacterized protein n=1 Tax=Anguilla anguilla TaxID=7936 RepID=A0A0E9VQW3_ANGAN
MNKTHCSANNLHDLG